MSGIAIAGLGAVSSAGWGAPALFQAVRQGQALPVAELPRPGREAPIPARPVPAPNPKPGFLAHPRLRRSSAVTRFAVAAALEALGGLEPGKPLERSGVILCVMSGCVAYSRRFYHEVWDNPPSASPLLFPETVFNAPSSHLATLLGATGLNYTLVGDPGVFLQGLATAGFWLQSGQVDECLVVGAEEVDWVTADSFRLFARRMILAEGAGALLLRRANGIADEVRLTTVTNSHLLLRRQGRGQAAQAMRAELPAGARDALLCEGTQGLPRYDAAETAAWRDWPGQRLAPKVLLGEGLAAAAAWQCLLAVDALREGQCSTALVSVVGCNQQAIGASFTRA